MTQTILWLLSGGFLAGYRTKIIAALLLLQAILGWMVGDMSLTELMEQLPTLLAGLGLMAAAAHRLPS